MATKSLLLTAIALASVSTAAAQPAPQKITIGIYAPSVEFGTAQARLAYVQGLAKAIEQNTGIKTEAQSYASLGALKKDAVDFAILDGQCYATNMSYKLIAAANIGGGTSRAWALYSNAGDAQALKGKKLAIINTGCNDAGFVDNAMLESEIVDPNHFVRVGKPDLSAAIAEVASYKTAQAVFAPSGAAKGLTKLFDTGSVPNPAFVDIGGKLPAATVEKVSSAVLGYGGGGAIASWQKGDVGAYRGLAGRFGKVVKSGVLVTPELPRVDAKDAMSEPATLKDTAMADVRHHFLRSPGARME